MLATDWFQLGEAQIILVGSGGLKVSMDVAKEIGAFQRPGVRMMVDPHPALPVYSKLGAKWGILRTFTWTSWVNVQGCLEWPSRVWKGALPTKESAGESFQQGATIVVGSDGVVRFRLIEESPGNPRVNHAALRRASSEVFSAVTSADNSSVSSTVLGSLVRFSGAVLLGAVLTLFALRRR